MVLVRRLVGLQGQCSQIVVALVLNKSIQGLVALAEGAGWGQDQGVG